MQNPEEVQRAVQALRAACPPGFAGRPLIGIILGTGLSSSQFLNGTDIACADLPGYPAITQASHEGSFVFGSLGGTSVLVQAGRCHLYEGRSPAEVCMGVRIMAGLGVDKVIITNAAGSLNPLFTTGSIMCITDQINHTGLSPLTGQNHEAWGVRFPDMSATFDKELVRLTMETATDIGLRLERGVYIGVHGPELETPAETRMYRQWGADAIGMSSVLEVIAARHLGLRVLGLSCLTNVNLPDCMAETSLAEIIAAANRTGTDLARLLTALVPRISAQADIRGSV